MRDALALLFNPSRGVVLAAANAQPAQRSVAAAATN